MKKSLKLLFVILALLPGLTGHAQFNLQLGFATLPPASVDTGQNFSFNLRISNTDTAQFIDTLQFGYYSSNAGVQLTSSNLNTGFSYQVKPDTINGLDSIAKTLTARVSSPVFIAGPSVVVIWPISARPITFDSLRFNIEFTVPNLNGINQPGDKNIRLLIINDELNIVSGNDVQLKQLRIYDAIGHEVLNKLNPSATTPLPPVNTGLYFAEVTYNNNQRRVFRFYH